MIVVKLMDGLGNQMFQYAFGRYLQEIYHEPLIFETSKLNANSVRSLGLDKLNIDYAQAEGYRFAGAVENKILQGYSKAVRQICEKLFHTKMSGDVAYAKMIKLGFYTTEDPIEYHPFAKTKAPVKFVRGYFQSEKYFNSVSDKIKEELKVKRLPDDDQKALIDKMHIEKSVAVHIRRGDYLKSKKFCVCTETYYLNAVKKINQLLDNPVYYVFSNTKDDLDWIRDNYHLPSQNIKYVTEGKDEIGDLQLMYNCKHHIISNSTFSWWGSYLSEGNVTIAPSRWYNDDEDYEDIYLKEWTVI